MRMMMAKPNYTRRAFTALAAVAVLAMLLLVAARPALAQTTLETPYISSPANNSDSDDGNIHFGGYSNYDNLGSTFDLYEVFDDGQKKKVGTGTGDGGCALNDCDCESG